MILTKFLNTISAVLLVLFLAGAAQAQTTGTLCGTVKDPNGAVVPGAQVTATRTGSNTTRTTATDESGNYTFTALAVGTYQIEITAGGFRLFRQPDLKIDLNGALQVDTMLELAPQYETVTITDGGAEIKTTDTQLGQVIASKQITDVPLNGRSYTDLLAVQAGVSPITTSGAANSSSGGGFGTVPAGGNDNTGQFSIHGQRESANGFFLNGVSVQEAIGNQAGIIPNLDSIAEFRILTSNVDAEYGNYSGGLINVVTKSGTNKFHGSAFEFLRNTALDAHGFFSPERSTFFQQNQYGGTLGGAIKKDKIFFFADYQGQRTIQGIETGVVSVPTLFNRTGNFADSANTLTGTVNGTFLAQTLSDRLGYQVINGEPFYSPGCTTTAQCVFPNAVIPRQGFAVPATRLLKYIPLPNISTDQFASGAEKKRLNDGKGSGRVDFNSTKFGTSSVYYFRDRYNLDDPYPRGFGGATVPGPDGTFNALSVGTTQSIILSNTRTIGANAVNELRLGYTRLNNKLGLPKGGVGVTLADQGISSGETGIKQGFPDQAGVELLYFNSFSVGTNPFSLPQVNNTSQVNDSFSKSFGNHTLKTGGQYILYRVKQAPNLVGNGTFSFFGTGNQTTGNGFADFLLGLPDFYSQQSTPPFYETAKVGDLFVQDSWRVRSTVTFNYGLRWDYITPWEEKYNQTTTFVQGVQSTIFPGAPLGYLVPGDPLPDGSTIPKTIAPTPKNNFSPRLGLAYSPDAAKGFLSKLTGGPGRSSIRVGVGRFFTAPEGLTVAYPTGNPPYGLTYTSPESPLLDQPFVGALTGTRYLQQFPVNVPSYKVSVTNPDRRDFSRYTPISGAGSVYYRNKTPYTMSLNLTLERQIGSSMVASVSYIGSLSRHLLLVHGANPGVPAVCLGVSICCCCDFP